MNPDQLKEALTGMGVSIPENATPKKLQALYDKGMAAKAAGGEISEDASPDDAADAEEIPELEIIEKMRAGLKREQAVEVIRHQRAHDQAASEF
jgi:hypothetical protein